MLSRYFHTIRYLKPGQIVARARFRLFRPKPDLAPPPPARSLVRTPAAPIEPAPRLLAPDVFRFLNRERQCSAAADWCPPDMPKLWVYNLHYFDDLNAQGAVARRAWHEQLIERWVRENPPGQGDGWEPYPVSRRIVNWIKWATADNRLPNIAQQSLAVQCRWLLRRLEYHLLGNHLLANAKALVYAGLYFEGTEAECWYERGIAILKREVREQVLPDGAHFELSTMYHATVLEDLIDLVNVSYAYGRKPPQDWMEAIERMRYWLGAMSHPDGDIAFFNDASFGVAPTYAALEAYASRLGLPPMTEAQRSVAVLDSSGYVTVTAGPAYLVCDCAEIGPDYLPGHAHADTLSFELSLFKKRIFVNSGTSQYGVGKERDRQRGTSAHNTVVIDGQDSSEVWSGFRVARRARARLHHAQRESGATVIEGSHNGYHRLPGRNEHRRRWTIDSTSLHIEDRITGPFRSAEACFHVHPQVDVRSCSGMEVELACGAEVRVRMLFEGAEQVSVQDTTWHPEFGIALPSSRVVARFAGPSLTTRVYWG